MKSKDEVNEDLRYVLSASIIYTLVVKTCNCEK